MNEFELKNKLELIFQQLLDIKFHLGEIETTKKCKEIEEENKNNLERLECLHNTQSTSWQYRRNLEENFRKKYDDRKPIATKEEE